MNFYRIKKQDFFLALQKEKEVQRNLQTPNLNFIHNNQSLPPDFLFLDYYHLFKIYMATV